MKKKEPIHKFNGGKGATLCHDCRVMISEGFVDELYCEEHGGSFKHNYKLVREHDQLTRQGMYADWIEWNDDGTFKEKHDQPSIGMSLVIDGRFMNYTWLTTTVTEVLEEREGYLKFKTKNSVYELYTNKKVGDSKQ